MNYNLYPSTTPLTPPRPQSKEVVKPAGNGEPVFKKILDHRSDYKCFAVGNIANVRLYLSIGKVGITSRVST